MLFLVGRTQETSMFYKQKLTKQYILIKIEVKFTRASNIQLHYVVRCVSRSPFDLKQTEAVIRKIFKFW